VARAKPSEGIPPPSDSPRLSEPASPPPETKSVVGTGWLIALSLWVTLFFLLVLYEGYSFLKGVIGF
jgi:hypothetical protein